MGIFREKWVFLIIFGEKQLSNYWHYIGFAADI